MRIEMEYASAQAIQVPPTFGIAIHRLDGVWCYGTNTSLDKASLFADRAPQAGTIVVELPVLQLLRGDYTLDVAVHNDQGDEMYDYIQGVLHFQVQDSRGDQGVFRPRVKWSFHSD
jgi:ABC-2 type transport system ATP-binding protein